MPPYESPMKDAGFTKEKKTYSTLNWIRATVLYCCTPKHHKSTNKKTPKKSQKKHPMKLTIVRPGSQPSPPSTPQPFRTTPSLKSHLLALTDTTATSSTNSEKQSTEKITRFLGRWAEKIGRYKRVARGGLAKLPVGQRLVYTTDGNINSAPKWRKRKTMCVLHHPCTKNYRPHGRYRHHTTDSHLRVLAVEASAYEISGMMHLLIYTVVQVCFFNVSCPRRENRLFVQVDTLTTLLVPHSVPFMC